MNISLLLARMIVISNLVFQGLFQTVKIYFVQSIRNKNFLAGFVLQEQTNQLRLLAVVSVSISISYGGNLFSTSSISEFYQLWIFH